MNLFFKMLLFILSVPLAAATPVSDDFSQGLNLSLWTKIDPVGDATFGISGNNTRNAYVDITVPCCVDHQPYTTENAPRVMQNITNTSFEVELSMESLLQDPIVEEGFIVEQSTGNYLRYDYHFSAGDLRSFASTFVNNVGTTRHNIVVKAGGYNTIVPLRLRINRNGSYWSLSYSHNNSAWVEASNFTYVANITKIGFFAGNTVNTPAMTHHFDYFFNNASRIEDEDPVVNVSTWTVSGYVNNSLGSIIQGARVDLDDKYDFTGADGYYEITTVVNGTYPVVVRGIGFENYSENLVVTGTMQKNFVLVETTKQFNEEVEMLAYILLLIAFLFINVFVKKNFFIPAASMSYAVWFGFTQIDHSGPQAYLLSGMVILVIAACGYSFIMALLNNKGNIK